MTRSTTTAGIYAALRERICLLDLTPGSRLTEEALAAEYGVSRTPIRQVLERLQHDRLVVQWPGAGTTVATVDLKEIRDVWAVRLKITELVGEFVRVPATAPLLAQLGEIRADLAAIPASGDVRGLGRLYNRYHDTMLELVTSETLQRIVDQLYHQTARAWLQFLPEMDLAAEVAILDEELAETIDALTEGSTVRLTAIRADHVRRLLDRFNVHVTRPLG